MTDHVAAAAVANTDPMPETCPAPAPRIARIATVLFVLDAALIVLALVIL